MSRIGDGSPYDPSHHVDWAYWACKGAPATIHPGAVVKMAEALEELANMADECDGWESFPSGPIDKARDALTAYYGEDV